MGKRGKEASARARALVYVNVRDVIFFLGVEGDAFRFLEINPAFTAATGLTEDAVVGKLVDEVIPEPSLTLVLGKYRTAIHEQRTVRWEEATDYPTGKKYGQVSITPILEPDGTCSTLVGTVHDVTADVHARVLGSAEQKVLEMVASGDSLKDTLTELVVAIEKLAPPAIASILLVSADGRIWSGAAPHLPKGFSDAIEGAHIGPYEGSCGAAAALRRPVIVTDIETDPLWDNYRGLAREHGLRACWSTPILSRDRRVLGTFALYYREPRSPREHDLDLVSRVVHVAGIAIGRHELDEQLRALSARIESAREEERTGIAREIHDQLGQSLTVLKMDLAWIVRRAQSQDGIGSEALVGKVTELAEMTDEIIGQVRRISAELRPGVLDDLGLSAALSWQLNEFHKRTGIVFELSLRVDDTKLRRDLATAIFRIVQEALTNVARHARAEHVAIELEERDGELHLDIADDGCGLPPAAATDPRSLGLLGMRERARRLGGTATFSERQPRGTVLHFVLDPGAPPSG